MNDRTLSIQVPEDVYKPGRKAGFNRAEVTLWCPDDMTPDRFREIAASKGAKLGVSCYSLGPKVGPWLMAKWMEGGATVVLRGPVDEVVGRRRAGA